MMDDSKNVNDAKGDVRTSIITVNYRVAHLVRGLVESIEKYPPAGTWELILVDNSLDSGQASDLKAIAEGRGNVKAVVADKNLGFSGGNNLGIVHASGEYLVFLNPDIVVRENCIATLVGHLESHAECGIAAPRVYWGDGGFQPTGRAFPNPLTGLFGRATILSKLFPNNPFTKKQLIDLENASEPSEVDWAAGMAWAVRGKEFADAGGWDERYFMYWEDADVAFRYKHGMGMATHYVPSAEATHFHAESARRAGSKAVREFHNSAYKYVVKNLYPAWYDPRRWFSWLALNLRAGAVILKNKLKG